MEHHPPIQQHLQLVPIPELYVDASVGAHGNTLNERIYHILRQHIGILKRAECAQVAVLMGHDLAFSLLLLQLRDKPLRFLGIGLVSGLV